MDVTVVTLEIHLSSDADQAVDKLGSLTSIFRHQVYTRLESALPAEEYQGLYGGNIPGPQTYRVRYNKARVSIKNFFTVYHTFISL